MDLMKPRNRFYGSSPLADPPNEELLIQCTHCHATWTSYAWRCNNGKCQGCAKTYAGKVSED
jgi:hypothetical protein